MARRQFLRHLGQRILVNFLLLQIAKLLRESLQALKQFRNGNGRPSNTPGDRLVEFEAAEAVARVFRVVGFRGGGGVLTTTRGHYGELGRTGGFDSAQHGNVRGIKEMIKSRNGQDKKKEGRSKKDEEGNEEKPSSVLVDRLDFLPDASSRFCSIS